MTKPNKTLSKFVKIYARTTEKNMQFCPEDDMDELSDQEILDLKLAFKDKSSLDHPDVNRLFVELKKMFIKQVIEGVKYHERRVLKGLKLKQKLLKSREARKLKAKIEKLVIKKLSPADRKLLDL